MWYIVCIIRVKNYLGIEGINPSERGTSIKMDSAWPRLRLRLQLGCVFCDFNNYWGLLLSWSCSLSRSCRWFLIYWRCFAAELFNRSSSSLQPVDFSFRPSSVLSFEFPFVTSVTALGFSIQFCIWANILGLNTYAASGPSLSKKDL